MTIGPFKLGFRTIKTALAVMTCILLFHLFDRPSSPMIACLASVFSMREDMPSTVSFGLHRILSNLLGGALALVYFYIYLFFNHAFWVELLILPLLVTFIIMLSDRLNLNAGIIGACATLFIIVLTVPETETFLYALARIMDTTIGTVVALLINRLIAPPKSKDSLPPQPDLAQQLKLLEETSRKQEQQLLALKKEVAYYKEKELKN
ncbi:FUSC family protein [Vagococcus intermedius]|uniref:Aromatic acid exporter family protein n=1 Tax=Vagococcus intermedius TaxID=2991418 RepID=A0AAF0CVY9_9ENTE|nr:aromatic acid exporter family protein [Vagococcus intermedius]WEG73883.1 aromatic acid exporter family protein [Vagococcus intermedius]WEG75967.1 aromatic acid exporter family protein [Vagococcus intermedius]